ncbi:MAG: hypothetical protein OXT09_06860 [Myxococcales bacterium]|nr:hypothetical protein [Myxococcales bacterium]
MSARVFAEDDSGPWLFGRTTDLWAFGGSAALSLLLLAVGAALGILHGDAPPWVWLLCIVLVDVGHVWSTVFRVYLDPVELRRRPLLYLGLPALCYGLGVMAHAVSAQAFWRVLAYVALFHFVRQQYGWVALYRRRAGERAALDRWLDTAAIYAATLYPVIHWHANLPRRFHWFVAGDFIPGLAAPVAAVLAPVYWSLLAAFCVRQVQLKLTGARVNAGKVLVVLSTFACWHLGIVAFDSDYAFTVTNVLIHGLPYMVLTYRHGRMRAAQPDAGRALSLTLRRGVAGFVLVVAALALAEEAIWDRFVWHDNPWLFGDATGAPPGWLLYLVPLLALPQVVHYALDGFIWKVRPENPAMERELTG